MIPTARKLLVVLYNHEEEADTNVYTAGELQKLGKQAGIGNTHWRKEAIKVLEREGYLESMPDRVATFQFNPPTGPELQTILDEDEGDHDEGDHDRSDHDRGPRVASLEAEIDFLWTCLDSLRRRLETHEHADVPATNHLVLLGILHHLDESSGGAPEDRILEEAEQAGIPRDTTNHLLTRMRTEGIIIMPEKNKYRVVPP